MIESARIFYEMLEQLYAQDNMEEVEHFLIREAGKFKSCGGFSEVAAAVFSELGAFYRRTGNFNLAVNWFNKSKYIVSGSIGKNTAEYAKILGDLADTYRLAGEYTKAEPLFLEALKVCEKTALTQTHIYAAALSNISLLHRAEGDFKTALVCAEKSLRILRSLTGLSHETAVAYNNLAELYERLGMQEKSAEARKRSEEIITFLK